MIRLLVILFVTNLIAGCGHTYYVVRHAEKAQPAQGAAMSTSNDPPLSSEGRERAIALKETMKRNRIRAIFSTNTIRTRSTAEPLAGAIGVEVQNYTSVDEAFIRTLKGFKDNVLIVGHSNTVDDIVNALSNEKNIKQDLTDAEYDNLFVVQYRGKKIRFVARKYGSAGSK